MTLSVQSIQTPIYHAHESLSEFLVRALKSRIGESSIEGQVVAVTSKIVSLSEGAIVPKASKEKSQLIREEADQHLGVGGLGVELTIKHGLLIPSAGIDESNSETGDYILFPQDPFASAKRLHASLAEAFGTSNFGLIITDSCPPPLRRGVVGVSLAHWGFKPTKSFVGEKDLFGRELKMTQVNIVDSVASMAVFAMGEASESSPVALISGISLEYTASSALSQIAMEPRDDLYSPLFKK